MKSHDIIYTYDELNYSSIDYLKNFLVGINYVLYKGPHVLPYEVLSQESEPNIDSDSYKHNKFAKIDRPIFMFTPFNPDANNKIRLETLKYGFTPGAFNERNRIYKYTNAAKLGYFNSLAISLEEQDINLSQFKQILNILLHRKEKLPAGFKLNLKNSSIDDKKLKLLCKSFNIFPIDTVIDLSNNNLTDDVILIADVLPSGPEGLTLDLSDNFVGIIGIEKLSEQLALGKCPQYFHLILANIPLSKESFQLLANALKSGNCPEGFELSLANTDFTINTNSEGKMEALCEALMSGKCPKNFKLDLSNSQINDVNFEMLMNALQSGNIPDGFEINLSGCGLTAAHIQKICDALQVHITKNGTNHIKLDLSHNSLNGDSLQMILNLLANPNCPKSLRLNLSQNLLSTDDVLNLITSLENNSNLTEINIRSNPFDPVETWQATNTLLLNNIHILKFIDKNFNMESNIGEDFDELEYEHERITYYCCKRNELIAQYPDYEIFIKSEFKKFDLYTGPISPPSLSQSSALRMYSLLQDESATNNRSKLLDNMRNKKIPSELKEFFDNLARLHQEIVSLVDSNQTGPM